MDDDNLRGLDEVVLTATDLLENYAMHFLLVPHALEIISATVAMLILLFWPVYICREITDVELEEAYSSDHRCAEELSEHLELFKNDTVVDLLMQSDNSTENNTWLNIRRDFFFWKHSTNNMCAMLGFRARFGAANRRLGSAHLLIPIVGAIVTIFFLWAHIFELITNKKESPLRIQAICGFICWLIVSVSLAAISCAWNGSTNMVRNLGAPFPLEWEFCKYGACFWVAVKIVEFFLADYCQKVEIKFDKPLTLTVVDFPADYLFMDEIMPPYPNEYDTMENIVVSL